MTQIGGVPDMHDEDDYPYDNPVSRAQAESLREQARAGGLRFEVRAAVQKPTTVAAG